MKNHAYVWGPTPPLTKLLRAMKLTTALMFATVMTVSAGGFSQDTKITLSLNGVKFIKLFKAIEKETDYRFTFSNDIIPAGRTVTVNVNEVPLSQVLDYVFASTKLKYRFVDESGIIIISEKNGNDHSFNGSIAASYRPITGKVTNDRGEPLTGVSILVKGTVRGTTTNSNGAFSIDAEVGDMLEFSMVGFKHYSLKVGQENTVAIQLEAEVFNIDEVVVVGYGTQKRKSVTGAVSSVSSKTLNELPALSISQALQGRVAGLQVTNNGSPGAEPIVRIRGISSISFASDPLYIVDGFPTGDLATIDVKDIESVDVLKDASAAAIYGSRATNGVIMITTKKGRRDGRVRVSLDSYCRYSEGNRET